MNTLVKMLLFGAFPLCFFDGFLSEIEDDKDTVIENTEDIFF
jgi:hypothetical protein